MISDTLRRHVPGSFSTLWLRPVGTCFAGGGGGGPVSRFVAADDMRVAGKALRQDDGLVLPAELEAAPVASEDLKRPKKRGLVGDAGGEGDASGAACTGNAGGASAPSLGDGGPDDCMLRCSKSSLSDEDVPRLTAGLDAGEGEEWSPSGKLAVLLGGTAGAVLGSSFTRRKGSEAAAPGGKDSAVTTPGLPVVLLLMA